MSDPIRLRILKALTEHLKGINPTSTDPVYEYDLSKSVFRGKNLLGVNDKKELPALSIIESPNSDIANFTGEWNDFRRDNWTILIMGLVREDKNNPSDEAYVVADVVAQRLGRIIATKGNGSGKPKYPNEHLLGGLINGLDIAPPIVRNPDDKVSSTAFFYLPIRVGVVDDLATG